MAVDGGQVYTAGKCGLVPAMVEQYDEGIMFGLYRNHRRLSCDLICTFCMILKCAFHLSLSLHSAVWQLWR